MSALRLVALLLPLSLDTFAISAAAGLTGLSGRQRLRLSLLFAVFEGGAPAIGVILGGPLGHVLGSTADYVAAAILIGIGAFMWWCHGDENTDAVRRLANVHGAALLLLGLSVSLDELAVGFTLGLLRLAVVSVLVGIAIQVFVVSQLGFALGARIARNRREAAARVAGAALVTLGVALLANRLLVQSG